MHKPRILDINTLLEFFYKEAIFKKSHAIASELRRIMKYQVHSWDNKEKQTLRIMNKNYSNVNYAVMSNNAK